MLHPRHNANKSLLSKLLQPLILRHRFPIWSSNSYLTPNAFFRLSMQIRRSCRNFPSPWIPAEKSPYKLTHFRHMQITGKPLFQQFPLPDKPTSILPSDIDWIYVKWRGREVFSWLHVIARQRLHNVPVVSSFCAALVCKGVIREWWGYLPQGGKWT